MIAVSLLVTCVDAKEIDFQIAVDKVKVSLGRGIQLSLIFDGAQDIPLPRLSDIDGFDMHYVGPSSRTSIINGRVSSSITYNFRLLALEVGQFDIGPFTVNHQGKVYTSNGIVVEVIQGPVSQPPPQQGSGDNTSPPDNLKDRVFIIMQPAKTKVYLNELIPLDIRLYVNKLPIRNIRHPEFAHDGFSVEEFEAPQRYEEILGGILYEGVEFKTHLFATRPGELRLGPARLKCDLVVKKERRRRRPSFFDTDMFDDFFGGYETYSLNLKSVEMPITVMPLPEKAKPENFSGAVGHFTMEVKAGPRDLKVGDPITLRITVKGTGNMRTINVPVLSSEVGLKIYEPQVTQSANEKVFEQIIMPKTEKLKEIPQINFSFFDPTDGQYHTLSRGPIPVKVSLPEGDQGLKIIEAPQVATRPLKKEVLGRDIIYIKDPPGRLRRRGAYLHNSKAFLLFQVIPFLFLVSALTFFKRNQRLKTDIRYARRLRAPKKARLEIQRALRLLEAGKTQEFYNRVFKTLQEYLGDKYHLPIGGITIDIVDEVLRPVGVEEDILSVLKEIFRDCDMVRYAPSEFTKSQMAGTYKKLQEVIDSLERRR